MIVFNLKNIFNTLMRRVSLRNLLKRVPVGERERSVVRVKRASELCTEISIKAASGSPVIVIWYVKVPDEAYIAKYM